MGLKIETWNVAFRKRGEKFLFNDLKKPFKVIKNDMFGWVADPFLFDYKGETYLFVEYFSYKTNKGEIAYAKYDKKKDKFSKYKSIIVQDYHMSYPLIFEHKGNVYMMPETSQAETLEVYKAIDFPEKWEKLSPLIKGEKLTDTTPVEKDGKSYAFTYRIDGITENEGELLLIDFSGGKAEFNRQGVISQDSSLARPGGKLFYDEGKLIRVSQDCTGQYGRAVNFLEVMADFDKNYSEKLIAKIEPDDINLISGSKPCGIHTYNVSNELEVVDLKYNKWIFIRIIYKLFGVI